MDPNTQRAEAERWLGIAAKLLTARDFLGSKTFAIRARESDPNNVVSDQILAVVDTILSGEKRVNSNQQPDWYAILQLPQLVRDPELIGNHYHRLVMLLNPDRNRLPYADYALQLAMDAWSVLSDPTKKWLFDNELALYLQRSEPSPSPVAAPSSATAAAAAAGTSQLNTFQFFQPQPAMPMWQQQPPPQQQPPRQQQNQIDFMPPQPSVPPQQLPPQWQMRDPTPAKGGERNKGSMNGIGGSSKGGVTTATNAEANRPTYAPPPQPPPQPPATPTVVHGNVGNTSNNNAAVNENHDNVVREVENFWTSCPYCYYIYEYQKIYQDCTIRCQNCKRGFHALQIPKPPSIDPGNDSGKDKESSFCCWGFFPLGFSMEAWRKHSQIGNQKGSSNWVPFSPMFACPVGNGDGNFQWFTSTRSASIGPKKYVRKASSPRVQIIDDDDDVEVSDPSNSDSSDHNWQHPRNDKMKKKKKRRRRVRGGRRGRPQRVDRVNQENQENPNIIHGGGVSVGGENLEDDSEMQELVVGLAAGDNTDASKNVASTVSRKHNRRSVKDMGRLDLNVEFNNEGDEHAPTVSAVNGEEDGIETIGFFEGLDEFFSTLPILNVGRDEKAKPS